MPIDLITTAETLAAWPQFSAVAPADQAALVTAASRRFESECDRVLGLGSYTEVHRPGRTRKVYTRQKPVLTVSRVATDYATVMTVRNTDPAVFEATVGFTGPTTPEDALPFTGLTLAAVASGVAATPVVLPFSAYPTLATLAAAINAAPGWRADVANGGPFSGGAAYATFPTAYLAADAGQMGCTLLAAELKAYTRALSFACDQEMARKGVIELFEGQADGYRYPDRRYGGWAAGFTGLSGVSGGTDPRVGGVSVAYAAGYPVAEVPGDVKRAVLGIVRLFADAMRVSGVYESQTFKDYSESIARSIELPKWVKEIAYNHSRKEVF